MAKTEEQKLQELEEKMKNLKEKIKRKEKEKREKLILAYGKIAYKYLNDMIENEDFKKEYEKKIKEMVEQTLFDEVRY